MNSLRADDDRADRRGERLREAELDRVDRGDDRARRDAEGGGGIEDPRAVEVDRHTSSVRDRRDLRQVLRGEDRTATAIVGVLQAEDAGARITGAGDPDQIADLLRVETPEAIGAELVERQAAERRRTAALVPEDVALVAEQDLITTPAVREYRDQIPHRAGGDVARRFLAERGGGRLFETPHRRVFAVLVVADLGFGHRPAHRRRRDGSRYRYADRRNHRGAPSSRPSSSFGKGRSSPRQLLAPSVEYATSIADAYRTFAGIAHHFRTIRGAQQSRCISIIRTVAVTSPTAQPPPHPIRRHSTPHAAFARTRDGSVRESAHRCGGNDATPSGAC